MVGSPGGFANGSAYGLWAVGDSLLFWYALRHASGIDVAQKGWVRNWGRFMAYFDPPGSPVRLSVDAQGTYFWNENRIDDQDLPRMLKAEAAKEPQPELHIRGDKEVRYERVAQLMSAAQQSGLRKIGFITEPKATQP